MIAETGVKDAVVGSGIVNGIFVAIMKIRVRA
jgi:hypothetical protein